MSGEPEDRWEVGEYASPPCFLHELSPGYGLEPGDHAACSRLSSALPVDTQAQDREAPATDSKTAACG